MVGPSPEQVRSAAALQQIRGTYDALDRWRARSKSVEEPQQGSDLEGDTAIWPGFPPHQVARLSLMAAVQHLNLARVALEAQDLYPIAHPTVLRGALLASSRGVWLLWPDDRHERQQRALRTIHEVHRRWKQFVASGATDLDAAGQAEALAELESRVQALRGAWAQTPAFSAAHAPSETEIVEAAAQVAFTAPRQQTAVPWLWMQLSGDAHGLGWPLFTRASTEMIGTGRLPGYPRPMAEYRVGADLFELAEAFMAAFMLLRRGWSLFDQRCEAP